VILFPVPKIVHQIKKTCPLVALFLAMAPEIQSSTDCTDEHR